VSKNKTLAQRLPFYAGDVMHSRKRFLFAFEVFALLALACAGSAARVEKATQPVEQKSTYCAANNIYDGTTIKAAAGESAHGSQQG